MPSVVFYFQVHQPYRLGHYSIFDAQEHQNYFDEENNKNICRKVADKCYLPMNKLIFELIKRHNGKFKVAYSISGIALEQFEKYCPEVIASFRALAMTGCVEFLGETYHHSLSFLFSKDEFYKQIKKHEEKILNLFDYQPNVFRNTELVFNNELANYIENLGYIGILAEGIDHILGWRSANFLYHSTYTENRIKLMLKNYKLSDDIAFRFSNRNWDEYPLTADKYTHWINRINGSGEVVNLFMDYETFGEHQWADTGIFSFMEHLPDFILRNPDNNFLTPTEAILKYPARDTLDIHQPVSWADAERDLSAWLGNRMQNSAVQKLYAMEKDIMASNDAELIEDWRRLTTSDHLYYMCTKHWSDGDVHKYFSPYNSPYDAFINFINVLENMKSRLSKDQDAISRIVQPDYAIIRK
jgi:alpha-amylase